MYRMLVASLGLVSLTVLPAGAAVQRFTIDPSQSAVVVYEGVWVPFVGNGQSTLNLSDGESAWEVQWQARSSAFGGTFDLEILDTPAGTTVTLVTIANAQLTGDTMPRFGLPPLLSWSPATRQIVSGDLPGYFYEPDPACQCTYNGPTPADEGTFDGTTLDLRGSVSANPAFVWTIVGGDAPPDWPIDQSPMAGAFAYRLVASPVPAPEPETFLLLGLGLPLLGWMARRRR